MVDREARNRLAQRLRHFASGRITNQEFDDEFFHTESDDRAVFAVFHAAWYLYDDFKTYKMVGPNALDRQTRRVIARCILFLQGDDEYVDLPRPRKYFMERLLSWLTLGLLAVGPEVREDEWYEQHVWPFRTQDALETACQHPGLLCAAGSAPSGRRMTVWPPPPRRCANTKIAETNL